jgi:hypothetical protein
MGNSQENNEVNQVQVQQIKHSYSFSNILNDIDKPNLFWIDHNVENNENRGYQNQIRNKNAFRFKKFINIDECIEKLKKIVFKKTFIIVTGSFSKEFLLKWKVLLIN